MTEHVIYMKPISKWCQDEKCLKHHDFIPATARYQSTKGDPFSGWYWECDCGTTLFMSAAMLSEYQAELDNESAWDREQEDRALNGPWGNR